MLFGNLLGGGMSPEVVLNLMKSIPQQKIVQARIDTVNAFKALEQTAGEKLIIVVQLSECEKYFLLSLYAKSGHAVATYNVYDLESLIAAFAAIKSFNLTFTPPHTTHELPAPATADSATGSDDGTGAISSTGTGEPQPAVNFQ